MSEDPEIIVPTPAPEISDDAEVPVAPSLLESEHAQGLDEEVPEEIT